VKDSTPSGCDRCNITHIFTYWLDGKVTFFPHELQTEPTADTTHFRFVDVHRSPLSGNVDAAFLKTSLVGQWCLKKEDELAGGSRAYEDYLKPLIHDPSSQLNKPGPGSNKCNLSLRLSEDGHKGTPHAAVSVRLFQTGVLTVAIRWQVSSSDGSGRLNEQELDDIADLVSRPERTSLFIERTQSLRKDTEPSDSDKRAGVPAAGQHAGVMETAGEAGGLNVLAARCARHVAELFADDIRALAKNARQPKKAWFANVAVKRTDPTMSVTDLFKNWLPGYVNPYVVFAMGNLPVEMRELVRIRDSGGEEPGKDAAGTFCSQLICLSTASPSSVRGSFVRSVEYVLKNNIALGNMVVIADRKCLVGAGLSYDSAETAPLLETLTFSLECVFAASESTKRFIGALDKRKLQQNYSFNAHLATTYIGDNIIVPIKQRAVLELLGKTVEDLLKILSAARALSPCDERITQVESYVVSKTVIVAITETKKMQLNSLIGLAHNKMTATTRLYETSYNFVSSKNETATTDKVAKLTLWLSALTVALTVLTILVIGATLYYGEVHKVNGELIHEILSDIQILLSQSK
jgi:hypothetical protein